MSNKAITWAWDQTIGPREKLLLICLADAANDEDWQCWPSQRHIAEKTGYSIATVKRALKALEESGHIVRGHRLRHDGTRTSDLYTLTASRAQPDTPPGQADTTPVQPDTGVGYPVDRGTRSPLTYHEPSLEPSIEPKENLGGRASASTARGTRLPDGWMPKPETIQQMRDECPSVNLEAEHRRFMDYWADQPGAKGRKVRWDSTWRNWIRRANEDTRRGGRQTAADRNLERGYQIAQRYTQTPQQPSLNDNPFEADIKEIRA